MPKGRQHGSNRHERLLRSFSYNQGQGNDTVDASELGEDEVWSMGDGHDHAGNAATGGSRSNGDYTVPNRRGVVRENGNVGGLSVAFNDKGKSSSSRIVCHFRAQESSVGVHTASSVPVNVPDWQNFRRVDPVESLHDSDGGVEEHDTERLPPHEYLARSRQVATKSVFEGVGRTLKGRDLSRVRDAVWSQTGFNG